jgi:hypothetical protein
VVLSIFTHLSQVWQPVKASSATVASAANRPPVSWNNFSMMMILFLRCSLDFPKQAEDAC